jgi:hypothetical protein
MTLRMDRHDTAAYAAFRGSDTSEPDGPPTQRAAAEGADGRRLTENCEEGDVRVHGTASSYNNLGCRCDDCRAAASAARATWVQSLQDRKFADVPHGTPSGYRNWGCRCERCTVGRAAEAREQQRKKRARSA